MVHLPTAPYSVQFKEGPTVIVRNTFLDYDEAPSVVPLRRQRTAPARVAAPEEPDEEPVPGEAGLEHRQTFLHSTDEALLESYEERKQLQEQARRAAAPSPTPAAPSPQCLERQDTYDFFEHQEPYATSGAASGPGSQRTGLTAPAAAAAAASGAPSGQGVVMMPLLMPVPEVPTSTGGISTEWVFSGTGPASMGMHTQADWYPTDMGVSGMPMQAVAAAPSVVQTLTPAVPSIVTQTLARQAGGPSIEAPVPPTAPQPQTLVRAFSSSSGLFRIHWTIDARKLSGSDRVAVSPPFEIFLPDPITFKLMISPKSSSDGKGGASFRKAKGHGIVQLKCEAQVNDFMGSSLTFRFAIGSGLGRGARWERPRGPVTHNFTQNGTCGLPRDQEEWDFNAVVDEVSQTFIVCLEVLPQSAD